MIENVTVRIARQDDEPTLFEVGYSDLENSGNQGRVRTTKFGTEVQMRQLLQSCGVPNATIDELFYNAKP